MNFPHKELDLSVSEADADLISDLESLIAFAVQRQSDSISSRAFVAGHDPVVEVRKDVKEDQRDIRIKFFAGEDHCREAQQNGDRIFVTGHFRPDLVAEDSAG